MSVPLSDARPTSHCGSSHWSLPVRCQMPTGHGPDYHAGWTGKSGTPGRAYVRYWAETGVTEQLIAGVWQPMGIPGPRCEELLAEVDRLRAELAKYVGHEPTIAEEMAELSRRLDAVVALLPDSPSEDINASWIPPRRICAAVDGDVAAESVRNCFTDEAYRSSLTGSPTKPCGRSKAHPAHKHLVDRASWQCPGVAAPTT